MLSLALSYLRGAAQAHAVGQRSNLGAMQVVSLQVLLIAIVGVITNNRGWGLSRRQPARTIILLTDKAPVLVGDNTNKGGEIL